MCAGAVAAPFRNTSAVRDSTISISRSVAGSLRRPVPASIRTFDRIGIVFRRSTTLWTWLSAFRKAPRSTVIFMVFALEFQSGSGPRPAVRRRAENDWKPFDLLEFCEMGDSSVKLYQGLPRENRPD